MNVEETLRMYAPNWKRASEVASGDTISFWGNWVNVSRTEERNGGRDIDIFYLSLKDGSEKSFRCPNSDLVATKTTT